MKLININYYLLVASVLFLLSSNPLSYPVEIQIDRQDIQWQEGYLYTYKLDPDIPLTHSIVYDSSNGHRNSRLQLTENGISLPLAHSVHEYIVERGEGRFSHWHEYLYFSSSDNLDPRKNHTYKIIATAELNPILIALSWLIFLCSCLTILFIHSERITKKLTSNIKHLIAFILILIFSICVLYLSLDHTKIEILHHDDSGNIASMAAAELWPDRFTNDPVFNNKDNYSFYGSILIDMTQALSIISNDIGTAFKLSIFFIVFTQLTGFYLLGISLKLKFVYSLCLAIISLPPVYIWGSELWGIFHTPLARMLAYAIFPFALIIFVRTKSLSLKFLVITFSLLGGITYIYPSASPSIAFAGLIGCFALKPEHISWEKLLSWLLASGLVYLIVSSLFIYSYHASTGQMYATQDKNYFFIELQEIFFNKAGRIYSDSIYATLSAIRGDYIPWSWRWSLWIFGILGTIFVWSKSIPEQQHVKFMSLFMIGIIISSSGVSYIDQCIASFFDRKPYQADLIRNLRFTIPILLILNFILLKLLFNRLVYKFPNTNINYISSLCIITLTFSWWIYHPTSITNSLWDLSRPLNTSYSSKNSDLELIIEDASTLEENSLFLPLENEIAGAALRYGALQPVLFLKEDLNNIIYAGGHYGNHWLEVRDSINILSSTNDIYTRETNIKFLQDKYNVKYYLYNKNDLSKPLYLYLTQNQKIIAKRRDWIISSP